MRVNGVLNHYKKDYQSYFLFFFNKLKVNAFFGHFLASLTLFLGLFIRFDKIKNTRFWQNFYYYYPQLSERGLYFGDPLRFVIQSLYLVFFKHPKPQEKKLSERFSDLLAKSTHGFLHHFNRFDTWVGEKVHKVLGKDEEQEHDNEPKSSLLMFLSSPVWENRLLRAAIACFILLLLALYITVPFTVEAQAMFMSLILLVAYALRSVKGALAKTIMVVLSVSTSTRYLWWRYTETLNWDDPLSLFLGMGLLLAETYAWLVLLLGFFQTVHPLKRKPTPLPKNTDLWPTVDIYIPTYNEPLSVVRPTTMAAKCIDWPQDKINVYILDDGKRDEFKAFAEEVGVGYLTRSDNNHAKAGNLNTAMKNTQGDFVAIFDCDHVPTRSFLQMTMGDFLKDSKVALVQTPHHFYSADPFERNLKNFAQIPNENMLFYGLIQDGNDMWDATFFCGSCAVLRRSAVEEIGGFAFETVTEDAHTALKMQRKGYKTSYINIPQAAGLATDSLSAHVGQRIRWARGMAQIFRIDNPLLGRGLNIKQRLCYLNAMLHFLSGIPRIVFLTAPLALVFLNAYIIYAPFWTIFVYVVPTLLQVKITNSRIQGKYRYSFWGEVYESVLAWYILKPTTVALINPNKGKFNVTEKGGFNDKEHYDWNISKPYVVLLLLNVIGFLYGSYRLIDATGTELAVLVISLAWVVYNGIILGAAVAVAAEARQVRRSHRIAANFSGTLVLENHHTLNVTVTDYSDTGLGFTSDFAHIFKNGQKLTLILHRGTRQFTFPVTVCNTRGKHVGVLLGDLDLAKQFEYIQCTFSRADAWLSWQHNFEHDKPGYSFKEVQKTALRGYKNLLFHAPSYLKPIISFATKIIVLVHSFMPQKPLIKQ